MTFLVASSAASTSFADAESERRADHLFTEAKDLAMAGKYAEACPKLEESQRLDPALGTEFNLADCYEHVGRTATAWRLFSDVARAAKAAGKTEREESARTRVRALEPRLAKLRITGVATTATVLRDAEELPSDQLSGAPVDPGEHAIEVRAPGMKPWRTSVKVTEGTVDVAVPALEPLTATTSPPPPPPLVDTTPRPATGLGTQRTLAIVTGALGVVGVGVGSAFGFISMSKHGDASGPCPQPSPCHDAKAAQAWTDATSAGNLSTIGFAVGGVALAGAAALWLLAPKQVIVPTVSPSAYGLAVRGTF